MFDEDAEKTGKSLQKIKRICRVLNIAIWLIFALLCVFWCISMGSLVLSAFDQTQVGQVSNIFFKILLCLAFGVSIAIMFVVFTRFFSDVSKGESPFSMKQVKRLRIISGMLLVYFVLDTAITNNSLLLQTNGFDSGYMTTNDGDNAFLTVNFGSFIAAAVVFAFSFVFKYGVLLQEFSDETL